MVQLFSEGLKMSLVAVRLSPAVVFVVAFRRNEGNIDIGMDTL